MGLVGDDAFVEDSTAQGSNSALSGLALINKGALLVLHDGASVSTSGPLSIIGNGKVVLDPGAGDGGSSLNIGGALTNSGTLGIGNTTLSAPDKVTVTSVNNTGDIILDSSGGANQALLDVTTGTAGFGAAGVLSGIVELDGDSVGPEGPSAIEFASGQITSLAVGSILLIAGKSAFIEDSTALGSNSALTGLASIGTAAGFDLYDGATVSTAGALVNGGYVGLFAGSRLTVGGTLTNDFDLNIGSGAALNVSGATLNNNLISIVNDTEELAGAVGGAGSFSLSNANLQFDSSVSTGQTINESSTGANALTLEQAQNFAATIKGFGTGDTIDAANFLAPPATTFKFVENSGGTGGTLTLHDGSLAANILMTGVYSNSDFTLAPDSGTGTLVKFV